MKSSQVTWLCVKQEQRSQHLFVQGFFLSLDSKFINTLLENTGAHLLSLYLLQKRGTEIYPRSYHGHTEAWRMLKAGYLNL